MANKFADMTLEQLASIGGDPGSRDDNWAKNEMTKRSIVTQIEATEAQKNAAFWMKCSVFVMTFATIVNAAVGVLT